MVAKRTFRWCDNVAQHAQATEWNVRSNGVEPIEASAREGVTRIEELKIDTSGHVEVEGEDDQGELEVNFRSGDSKSATVERDS